MSAGSVSGADAAARLEREWREPLVRFCRRYLRSAQDAEDAASEVIVKVLESRDVPERIRPWILRIARNRCLQRLRDAAPREAEPLDGDERADATGPSTAAARADDRAALERILSRLTAHERELLRLRYSEDLPRDEIATVLDLPESVVKSRLYEALEKLRAAAGPLQAGLDGAGGLNSSAAAARSGSRACSSS